MGSKSNIVILHSLESSVTEVVIVEMELENSLGMSHGEFMVNYIYSLPWHKYNEDVHKSPTPQIMREDAEMTTNDFL